MDRGAGPRLPSALALRYWWWGRPPAILAAILKKREEKKREGNKLAVKHLRPQHLFCAEVIVALAAKDEKELREEEKGGRGGSLTAGSKSSQNVDLIELPKTSSINLNQLQHCSWSCRGRRRKRGGKGRGGGYRVTTGLFLQSKIGKKGGGVVEV